MILPTVREISHERAVELQREWQQSAAQRDADADQAKAREAATLKSTERR